MRKGKIKSKILAAGFGLVFLMASLLGVLTINIYYARGATIRTSKDQSNLQEITDVVDGSRTDLYRQNQDYILSDALREEEPHQFRWRATTRTKTLGLPEGEEETSYYMVGKVRVALIYSQSDGSIDPIKEAWTEEEKETVRQNVVEALNWWTDQAPGDARLSLTLDPVLTVSTSYEPAYRDMFGSLEDRSLWVNAMLNQICNNCYNFDYYKDNLRAYAHDLRGTAYDWAVIIFAAHGNSYRGYTGFANLGGPGIWITHRTNSSTIAHELAHSFWALDEYCFQSNCWETSGILSEVNGNVSKCSSNHVPCIMGDSEDMMCYFTKSQVGWRDQDADGILDSIDSDYNSGLDENSNGIVDYWDGIRIVGARNITIRVGNDWKFRAVGSQSNVIWTSSNPSVGTIDDNGTFLALKEGEAVINVQGIDGKISEDAVHINVANCADFFPPIPVALFPADGSEEVSPDMRLIWHCPSQSPLLYSVFLGTSEELTQEDALPESTCTEGYFLPSPLEFNKTYYWKVIAYNGNKEISSPVFKFTTKSEAKIIFSSQRIFVNGIETDIIGPNDTVALILVLTNLGSTTISKVTGEIKTGSDLITISKAKTDFGDIGPNGGAISFSPFEFTVSGDIRASYNADFTLIIYSQDNHYQQHFEFSIPVMNCQPETTIEEVHFDYGLGTSFHVIDKNNPDIMYVGSGAAGLFKTMDGGQNWMHYFEHASVNALAIDPDNSQHLLVNNFREPELGGGIHESWDGGVSWNKTKGVDTRGYWIGFNPHDTNNVLAINYDGGRANIIYESKDSGATWNELFNSDFTGPAEIIFSKTNPDLRYLKDRSGFYKSIDNGENWINISTGKLPFYIFDTASLVLDPCNENILYATESSGLSNLYKSSDGGQNWNIVYREDGYSGDFNCLMINEVTGDLYLFQKDDVVSKSSDGGLTFQIVCNTPMKMSVNERFKKTIYVDKSGHPTFYLWETDRFYKSSDNGQTWQLLMDGLLQGNLKNIVTLTHDPSKLFAITEYNVYGKPLPNFFSSVDGGLNYEIREELLKDLGVTMAIDILQDKVNPNEIYLVAGDIVCCFTTYARLFKSLDSGQTWNFVSDIGKGVNYIKSTLIGDSGEELFYTTGDGNLILSNNKGVSWETSRTEEFTLNTLIAYTPQIFAALSGGKIFVSNDGGTTWLMRMNGIPIFQVEDVQFSRDDPSVLYAIVSGSYGGIYKTIDFGLNWIQLNNGFSYPPSVAALWIDPQNPEHLIAGKNCDICDGLYESYNGGMFWRRILQDIPLPIYVNGFIDIPNTNSLYITTGGQGLFKVDLSDNAFPIDKSWYFYKGLNIIGYPSLQMPADYSSFDLLALLSEQKSSAVSNFVNGEWKSSYWNDGTLSGTDFMISHGQGYLIYMKDDITIPLNSQAIYQNPSLNLTSGCNIISIPLPKENYFVYDLATDMEEDNISCGQKYNNLKGKWEGSYQLFDKPAGVEFKIKEGEGYIVYMKTNL